MGNKLLHFQPRKMSDATLIVRLKRPEMLVFRPALPNAVIPTQNEAMGRNLALPIKDLQNFSSPPDGKRSEFSKTSKGIAPRAPGGLRMRPRVCAKLTLRGPRPGAHFSTVAPDRKRAVPAP